MVADPAPARVDLPGGPITLEPLDRLTAAAAELNATAQAQLACSNEAAALAAERLAQAGAVLAAHPESWDVGAAAAEVAALAGLARQDAEVEADLATLAARDHGGLGGAVHGLLDNPRRHDLERRRTTLAGQLTAARRSLAEKAPATGIAEAESLRGEARTAQGVATRARELQRSALERAQALAEEIARRQTAAKQMGFDSLYTAACLESRGPEPVDSPLALKPKEQAYVSMPAVLARVTTRTRYVGGGQGMSFPVGHTGIRYRVGTFSGHPVTTSSLVDVDEGTLVLSSQRVVFIGRMKSTVTPLAKIVHVESYSDALAVFQEGRENPNFYRLATPQYFLLHLNWVLGHDR